MSNYQDYAARIARDALPLETVKYGPWLGSMRSVPATEVPREYMAGGTDYLYLPRDGAFKRRSGQTIKFDVTPSSVGLLPAKWSARIRHLEEFVSPSISDNVPTLMGMLTKETVASGLDDGLYSQVWVRDQVGSTNYTLGSDYDTNATYPAPGAEQKYKIVPLWYDSGGGGITRGVSELDRRFFVGGSRNFRKIGNWFYFPSLLGTPSRWSGTFSTTTTASQYARPNADGAKGTWRTNTGSTTNIFQAIDESTVDDTDYIDQGGAANLGSTYTFNLSSITGPIDPTRYYVVIRARFTTVVATNNDSWPALDLSAGATGIISTRSLGQQTASPTFQTNTIVLTPTEINAINAVSGGWANLSMTIEVAGAGIAGRCYLRLSWLELAVIPSNTNRLMPSGPLSPCHAGSLARGTGSAAEYMRPDADSAVNGWRNQAASAVNLFNSVDETVADNTDYVTSLGSNSVLTMTLSNPTFTPAAGDQVTLRFRMGNLVGSGHNNVTISLKEGGVTKAGQFFTFYATSAPLDYSVTLTDTEIAAVSNWNNLTVDIVTSSETAVLDQAYFYWIAVELVPASALGDGGWQGKHRFYWSVAYRFEDDSVWMPVLPQAPNATNSGGLNLFTVDVSNPETHYDKVVWQNLPIGWYGVKSRLLLRTPKIDSTLDDNLLLNPLDLRIVAEIDDNTTTSYDDYFADDASLTLDPEELLVRLDHIMPPRARYMADGEMRVLHQYGGQNPCAIQLAPVGRTADFDLNLPDDSTTLYSQNAQYMRLLNDGTGSDYLELWKTDGTSSVSLLQINLATYNTLQKLIDRINITTVSVDGLQWRAQLCPGVNPNLDPLTVLTPHTRILASCITANGSTTITRAAGGLSKLAVGMRVTLTNVTVGSYITEITSDYAIKISAVATGTGTNTGTFAVAMGDAPTVATSVSGYQRVVGNCLPGFLYFSNDYLDLTPIEKGTVWMTVASPGSVKSAPNCFSGKLDNVFRPPGNPGIGMGAFGVENGFVVTFSKKIAKLVNTRDTGSGLDKDYKMRYLNENRGCCAWATVHGNGRFGFYLTHDGLCAASLDKEGLVSKAIYDYTKNLGDLSYEVPLSVAAAAKDDDTSYAYGRIMRSGYWLNYRTAASATHPNRQVNFPFDTDEESSGIDALFQKGKGWSLPLVRSVSAMAEGRRSDGWHLYGWNDQNAGSTGDGRVDEIETGDTDNGSAIVADCQLPWERGGRDKQVSFQEATVEHNSPVGSTGFLDVHRGYADSTSNLTLSNTSDTLPITRDIVMFPQAARVQAEAYFLSYRQTTGGARTLRRIWLKMKTLPSFK